VREEPEMGVEVYKDFFESLEDVLEDLKKTGFWPTTFVSPPSPQVPLHWHDSDLNGYIMQGEAVPTPDLDNSHADTGRHPPIMLSHFAGKLWNDTRHEVFLVEFDREFRVKGRKKIRRERAERGEASSWTSFR
jgi:hypothetical protein